jgi:hypothetical protein
MATATFDKLPDEPIVIVTVTGDPDDLSDSERDISQLRSLFDRISESVFLILDMTNAEVGFDGLLRGASNAYRGDNPTFRHPNIREILHVSDDPGLELAARGMDSEMFGNVKIHLFETLSEALAYARATQ